MSMVNRPVLYLPKVEFTQLHARSGDVLTIHESNIVCIYDPFTGIAACTGVPPGGVVLVATNPVDMASALLSVSQKLRREGIPAKDVQVVEKMIYTDQEVRGITNEEVNLVKSLVQGYVRGLTPAAQY